MNLLQRLIGQKVIGSEETEGPVVLTFTDASFAAYNPVSGAPPKSCIGAEVSSVEFVKDDKMSLVFSNGLTLAVSLREEDYSGPEAFSVRFSDGTIVVQQ